MLSNYGSREKYHHAVAGSNARLDELQAAFLHAKLAHLETWNQRRREIALIYNQSLKGLSDLVLPKVLHDAESVWHLYVVRTPMRDRLQKTLSAKGVQTQIHYPIPPHLSGAYAMLGSERYHLPVTETVAQQVLSLPIGPHLSENQVEFVVDAVRDAVLRA